jgi:hypothetical protein
MRINVIISKYMGLKRYVILINEDLILEDQVELRKKVQKVKEAKKKGKQAIIRNQKFIIREETKKTIINRNLRHYG